MSSRMMLPANPQIVSASEPDSINNSDDNSSNDSILDYEEKRDLPAEYYLQEAEYSGVSRLTKTLQSQDPGLVG